LPPEVAAAPFEPRRRSRARTAGPGLGLSIARGIVAAHGGLLAVTPAPSGASFGVRLPVEDSSGLRTHDGALGKTGQPARGPRPLSRKEAVARDRASR